jgi:hypothetical protein
MVQLGMYGFTSAASGERVVVSADGKLHCMYGQCEFKSLNKQGFASHKKWHVNRKDMLRTTTTPRRGTAKEVHLAVGQKSQTAALVAADDTRRGVIFGASDAIKAAQRRARETPKVRAPNASNFNSS